MLRVRFSFKVRLRVSLRVTLKVRVRELKIKTLRQGFWHLETVERYTVSPSARLSLSDRYPEFGLIKSHLTIYYMRFS